MRNYIALGDVLAVALVAAAPAKIASGDLVKAGDLVGVAATDILPGDSGSVVIEGVFEVPKAAGFAAPQGTKLYFDAAANVVNGTPANNAFAGYAYEAAAAGDATVRLRLIG